MNETALMGDGSIGMSDGTPSEPQPRAPLTGAGRRAIRLIGLVVVLASVVVSSGSFLIMIGATNISPSPEVWTVIWIANGILVLMVVALVLT